MEVSKEKVLNSIVNRLESEAINIQTIISSGVFTRAERKQLNGRMTEVIKQLARAQSAISQHTIKSEQLAKLTASAQSADDVDKAKAFIMGTINKT